MREIEIKLKVNDSDAIEKQLKKQGCIFSKEIKQRDVVYSSKNNSSEFDNAKEGHIAIRIRYEDDVAKLTLKQQRSYEMDNIEYETEIKKPDEIHQMLSILGWKPEVEVKKTRKKGKLGEYEVCLDRVEELGDYIELEKLIDDDASPDEARNELFQALKPFGLSEKDEENKGYDTKIYQLHHSKL